MIGAEHPQDPPPAPAEVAAACAAAREGAPGAVAVLVGLLLAGAGDAEVSAAALAALPGLDDRAWHRLDLGFRRELWQPSGRSGGAPEQAGRTRALRLRVHRRDLSPLCLGIAACHPDAFVRGAAVARIIADGPDELLPFLRLRAHDWVPEIRRQARAALLAAGATWPEAPDPTSL
ncbi:hypothetical protein [Allonocardiopsis opalescens]|uniref:HEAT repeat protein n=1 Tax=Allonocardiopsis opalescens TaxID=1144618 RepID=A0A2T0Q9S0_9ACTN|nr:hypothetical protein [Allonocardiopsis opalescens]PRY00587.1 hypothetical protein CLV72_102218 [Allonocardiopsis opalescens]